MPVLTMEESFVKEVQEKFWLRLDPKLKTNVKLHSKNILEFRRNKKSQNKNSEKNLVKK